MALAHLGDVANIASINPPSGEPQASHCSRFYPIARDALLEMKAWGFATVRVQLALAPVNPTTFTTTITSSGGTTTTSTNSTWQYAYAAPSNVLKYLAILDPQTSDDYSVGVQMSGVGPYSAPVVGLGVYTPQPFEVETDGNGNTVILTNQANAVLRYTQGITDTTKFSPLFVTTLSHYLASMVAGPLLKGEAGRAVAKEQLTIMEGFLAKAAESDASQRKVSPAMGAQWMVNR
jgi:hypothetical protein